MLLGVKVVQLPEMLNTMDCGSWSCESVASLQEKVASNSKVFDSLVLLKEVHAEFDLREHSADKVNEPTNVTS